MEHLTKIGLVNQHWRAVQFVIHIFQNVVETGFQIHVSGKNSETNLTYIIHQYDQGLNLRCHAIGGIKLQGDQGEIVSLHDQISPCSGLKEKFKCIEYVDNP